MNCEVSEKRTGVPEIDAESSVIKQAKCGGQDTYEIQFTPNFREDCTLGEAEETNLSVKKKETSVYFENIENIKTNYSSLQESSQSKIEFFHEETELVEKYKADLVSKESRTDLKEFKGKQNFFPETGNNENSGKPLTVQELKDDDDPETLQLKLENFPKNVPNKEVRVWCSYNRIQSIDVVKKLPWSFAFLIFDNEKDKLSALERIPSLFFRKKRLRVKSARKSEAFQTDSSRKMTPADQLNDKLCPYWRKRYEEQLSIKEKNADELFRDLANCLRINSIISKLGLRIMRSPVMTGYLNKLDLICGSDGRVGVPLKQNEDGEHMVVNPKECLIIPEVMKLLACEFENFLTTTSYQVYIEKTCSGHYQQLSLRTNRNSEVKFHPQNISAEQLNEEKFLLKTFFETLKTSKNITIKCLLFQQTEDSSPANPAEFLYGESSFLVENWMDLKFQVSISSLFPPNFSATTHLLMEILDWCSARKYHYIFDIFCGTGIQGLSLAPTVMKVIGIDESKEAIEEAEQNLAVNKYNNVQFIHGVVEDELPIIFKKYGHMESIGIVNRPMSFTSSLSRIIRSSAIKRLVYINTFSRNIMKDIACLCQDFAVNSKPFKVMKYRAFDTEPHNPNFEVAVLLERF